MAATCFRDRLLIQPDDFRCVARQSSGGWNRTNGLLVQSQASLPAATAPECCLQHCSMSSSGRRIRTSIAWFKARQPTVSRSPNQMKCPAGVEPACPAWKADAFAARPRARRRKERESNPQGSRSTFSNSCHRLLACPSVSQAAAAGIEPANRVTELPYRICHTASSQEVGFEPTISCSRSRRIPRLSHTLRSKAPSGSRTRTSAMARQQAAATSWVHSNRWSNCQRSKSTGWDSNPRRRITGAESSPLDDQCLSSLSVGPEGLEPSPTWLRARHAAANTLIPCSCFASRCARNRRGGNRTLDLVLIRDLLSPLSYAPMLAKPTVGPKGVEPLPSRLKGGSAAVTPRPRVWSGRMRLSRVVVASCGLSCVQ